jgi:hypothetical protein
LVLGEANSLQVRLDNVPLFSVQAVQQLVSVFDLLQLGLYGLYLPIRYARRLPNAIRVQVSGAISHGASCSVSNRRETRLPVWGSQWRRLSLFTWPIFDGFPLTDLILDFPIAARLVGMAVPPEPAPERPARRRCAGRPL